MWRQEAKLCCVTCERGVLGLYGGLGLGSAIERFCLLLLHLILILSRNVSSIIESQKLCLEMFF